MGQEVFLKLHFSIIVFFLHPAIFTDLQSVRKTNMETLRSIKRFDTPAEWFPALILWSYSALSQVLMLTTETL